MKVLNMKGLVAPIAWYACFSLVDPAYVPYMTYHTASCASRSVSRSTLPMKPIIIWSKTSRPKTLRPSPIISHRGATPNFSLNLDLLLLSLLFNLISSGSLCFEKPFYL